MCVCVCVCVAKPVAVELRCHATALISLGILHAEGQELPDILPSFVPSLHDALPLVDRGEVCPRRGRYVDD